MNKVLLDNFIDEVEHIEKYIEYIEIVNRGAINFKSLIPVIYEHIDKNKTQIKMFEYKAIIISLYGVLERYIETLIKEYVNNLPKVFNSYNLISNEQLKKNHLELSTKLIHTINENKQPKFAKLNVADVIYNLNNCISNGADFKLNADAFTIQSGNLNMQKLQNYSKKLALQG